MVKILSEGLLPPDDPMFSNGLETFSLQRSKQSVKTSQSGMDGAKSRLSHLRKTEEALDLEAEKRAEGQSRYKVRHHMRGLKGQSHTLSPPPKGMLSK